MTNKQVIANLLHELFGTDPLLLRHRLNELHADEFTFDQLIRDSWAEAELKAKPYPFFEPEVITLTSFHFGDAEDWIVESFLHGTRIQIHRSASGIKVSTEDQDLFRINEIECARELNLLPAGTVIDVLITGETSKDYFILDIHRWNEKEKTQLGSLLMRKEILSVWLKQCQAIRLRLIAHTALSSFRNTIPQGLKESWIIKNIHDDRRYRIKPEANRLFTAVMYVEYTNQNKSIQYIMTLGVSNHEMELIPLTRVSSDQLSGTDKNELHYWIQNNTIQKFGPVRVVRPGKIICIAYDRVQNNKRVKSGLALINVNIIKILNQSASLKSISSIQEIINASVRKDQDI